MSEVSESESETKPPVEQPTIAKGTAEEAFMELSVHAAQGTSSKDSIRLHGMVGKR